MLLSELVPYAHQVTLRSSESGKFRKGRGKVVSVLNRVPCHEDYVFLN